MAAPSASLPACLPFASALCSLIELARDLPILDAQKILSFNWVAIITSPSDPSNQASSVLDLSSASATALPGGVGSDSGSVTGSSAVEVCERSPPLTRQALSRPRKTHEHSSPYPNLTAQASYRQNILNVGASPQEVLDAQRLAATQAAQHFADHAEQLHAARLEHVENEARGLVEATVDAKRIDEHVPIFTSKCQFVHGLAASADSLDESGEECQEPSSPVAHDPAEEYAKDLLTKRGDIQPNS